MDMVGPDGIKGAGIRGMKHEHRENTTDEHRGVEHGEVDVWYGYLGGHLCIHESGLTAKAVVFA